MREIFGGNLSFWIRSGGRRQSWFAEKIGVAPSVVTRWMQADAMPRPEHMDAIEDLTGIPIAVFFIEDGVSTGKKAIQALAEKFSKV